MSVETDMPLETPEEMGVKTKHMDDIHPAARPFLFLGDPKITRKLIWIPLIGMIICIILGVFYPQSKAFAIEKYIPGSWAIFGFLSFAAIILSANTVFSVLARDEAYYGEGGLPNPHNSPEHAVSGEAHHD